MEEKSLNAQITLFLFIMSAPCLALLVLVGAGFAPSWPFVHDLDPVLLSVGGLKTYYYGLAYALGFLGMHFWLHVCGAVTDLLDDFISVDLDVLHPIQPVAMDQGVVARR